MFNISCDIYFSYGHRLIDYKGKCARLHGHNARVQVEVSSARLDKLGMVVDFHDVRKIVGRWIDDTLDHRMILCEKDPVAVKLKEEGEDIVLLAENPTAEVLARLIFQEARNNRLPVSKVTFWETENSFAVYHE